MFSSPLTILQRHNNGFPRVVSSEVCRRRQSIHCATVVAVVRGGCKNEKRLPHQKKHSSHVVRCCDSFVTSAAAPIPTPTAACGNGFVMTGRSTRSTPAFQRSKVRSAGDFGGFREWQARQTVRGVVQCRVRVAIGQQGTAGRPWRALSPGPEGTGPVTGQRAVCDRSSLRPGNKEVRRICPAATGHDVVVCMAGIVGECVVSVPCSGSLRVSKTHLSSTSFPPALSLHSIHPDTQQQQQRASQH